MRRKGDRKVTFHEDNSEPTDGEFNDEFGKHNTMTGWFTLIFFLSCLPTFCLEAERTSLAVSKNIEGTCIFPKLLKNNWTMDMVTNFTLPPNGRYCTYIAFNYTEIRSMTYQEATAMKNGMKQIPGVNICAVKLTPENYRWTAPNFLRTCASFYFKGSAETYRMLGEFFSTIVFGAVGDLYGRKMGLMIAYPIYMLGLMLLPVANHYYVLCIAYFCEGVGYSGLSLLSYILFLELCNPSVRGILALYITSLSIPAKLVAYYIKFSTPSYIVGHIMCSVPSLSLLFYLYYVPESPKWFMSYGRKKEAWESLRMLGVDISEHVFLPRITLPKFRILYDNLQILFYTNRYRKTVLIAGTCICIEGLLYQYKSGYLHVRNLKITGHKMVLLLADIFSFFNVLPPFIIFGRYISIMIMQAVTVLYLFVSILIKAIDMWFILNMLSVVTLSSMQTVLFLYCCELVPTCARATALALSWTLAKIMKILIGFIVFFTLGAMSTVTQNYFFFVLGVLALVAIYLLPRIPVYQLPDFKRYRNVIET